MITKEDGELKVECDDCGDYEFGGTMDFAEFIVWLKRQGWKSKKAGDEWQHICPICRDTMST